MTKQHAPAGRLIVRVTRTAPGFHANEPREYLARCVEPELRTAIGRGLTPGAALDRLLERVDREPGVVACVVDPDADEGV